MKTTLSLFFVLIILGLSAQVTIDPSCSSNTGSLTLKKITITDYCTLVDFEMYTTQSDYTFSIHNKMYIQEYNNPYSVKYYVTDFVNNELNRSYKAEAYTIYNFQLKFEKIPKGLTKIDIIEPYVEGNNAWNWKGISINNPDDSYLNSSISDFFREEGVKVLAYLAHPTNTFKSGTFNFYTDDIVVKINYDNGYYTELKINKEYGLFTGIEVIANNDWVEPFLTISFLKELVDEMMYEPDYNETRSELERMLGKVYYEFDGIDITLLILNMAWIGY